MVVCEKPITTKRYDFLFKHLNCSCIADTKNEDTTGKIKVIAYTNSSDEYNVLKDFFYANGYSGKYRILKGISSGEVDCIE